MAEPEQLPACPSCHGTDYSQTCMGIISGRDTNEVRCACGWRGEVWQLVKPDQLALIGKTIARVHQDPDVPLLGVILVFTDGTAATFTAIGGFGTVLSVRSVNRE